MTDAIEEQAETIFAEIERQGGMIAAIDNGYFRRRIADSAFLYQREVDHKQKLIVGVNAFTEQEGLRIPTLEIDESIERKQRENLTRVKQSRDAAAAQQALEGVVAALQAGENVMPALLEAARRQCAVGEIMRTMAGVLGRYNPAVMTG